MACGYSWFYTMQRSWRTGPHGRKCAGTKEIRTSDNSSIPVKLSSRCQTMLGQISQTSWELVCKGDVKENKCRTQFARQCQICEAIRSCTVRFRSLACADLWIPWSSTEHRHQPDLEPWPFTSYPQNSDNSSTGSHSLLWPVPHSQKP